MRFEVDSLMALPPQIYKISGSYVHLLSYSSKLVFNRLIFMCLFTCTSWNRTVMFVKTSVVL